MLNVAASRDPARPARANATATSAACRPTLRRAWRSVNPVPARRTCTRCSRRGRRRTGGLSTTPRPGVPRREDLPGAADSGCAPASTLARTAGSATPAPADARRSPPRRRPGRPGRSPPATAAGAEPGNGVHQPQPPEHHGEPAGITESAPEPDESTIHRPGGPRHREVPPVREGPGDLPALRLRPVATGPAGLGHRDGRRRPPRGAPAPPGRHDGGDRRGRAGTGGGAGVALLPQHPAGRTGRPGPAVVPDGAQDRRRHRRPGQCRGMRSLG